MGDDIIDIWVNLVTQSARRVPGSGGRTPTSPATSAGRAQGVGVDDLLERMDALGVATGVLTPGSADRRAQALEVADAHPGRFLVAACRRSGQADQERAAHPRARPAPGFAHGARGTAVDAGRDRRPEALPVYQVCEELALPVGDQRRRARAEGALAVQHPELLEDVLIDFPDLTVIGAHMGHPYEELLMNYMRKWDRPLPLVHRLRAQLHRPALVAFMNTSTRTGAGCSGAATNRGSRCSARSTRPAPSHLDDDAMALFLGGTARRLLDRRECRRRLSGAHQRASLRKPGRQLGAGLVDPLPLIVRPRPRLDAVEPDALPPRIFCFTSGVSSG